MLTFWRQNLPWMLFALVVSVATWAVVTRLENPDQTDTISNVPVEVTGIPADLVLRNRPQLVIVRVVAPRLSWARLTRDSFRAQVDASRAQAGVQELPVKVDSLDHTARVVATEPARVSLGLERIGSKEVRVQVQVLDTAPTGFRADTAIVNPDRLRVSGPESVVAQAVVAAANVRLSGARSRVSEWVRPVLLDADHRELRDLTVSPEQVLVEVPVEQELVYNTVAVTPQVVGEVTLGYQMIGIAVEPTVVTVVGEPAAVAGLHFLSTKPVDVARATRDMNVVAEPVLPPGVGLVRSQEIVVKVYIRAVPAQQTFRVSPTVAQLGKDLQWSVEPSTLQVVLSGPLPVLALISPSDIRVTVDASGLAEGTYVVTPTVAVPSTVSLGQVIPDKLTLSVRSVPPAGAAAGPVNQTR